RHAQIARREAPVEARCSASILLAGPCSASILLACRQDAGATLLLGPQHPGRKDSIKKGLNQAGPEEVLALFALKFQAQGFFQRSPHRCQCGEFYTLNTRPRVPSVRSQ